MFGILQGNGMAEVFYLLHLMKDWSSTSLPHEQGFGERDLVGTVNMYLKRMRTYEPSVLAFSNPCYSAICTDKAPKMLSFGSKTSKQQLGFFAGVVWDIKNMGVNWS